MIMVDKQMKMTPLLLIYYDILIKEITRGLWFRCRWICTPHGSLIHKGEIEEESIIIIIQVRDLVKRA